MILDGQEMHTLGGSCPHTRGDDPLSYVSSNSNNPLVPTRVGMILDFPEIQNEFLSCPHTRGDDPPNHRLTFLFCNLSPHAWG